MSRYIGPTTRINRRFGKSILPLKKSFEKRKYLPGQHGPRLRRKLTPFSIRLLEKQKLRMMYGLNETSFRILFEKAKKKRGITGEILLTLLELRLDNIVYRIGFAKSRASARQLVNHGHILVNSLKVDIPSYKCKIGDLIEIRKNEASIKIARENLEISQYRQIKPLWIKIEREALRGSIIRNPSYEELDLSINIKLIVEYYSR